MNFERTLFDQMTSSPSLPCLSLLYYVPNLNQYSNYSEQKKDWMTTNIPSGVDQHCLADTFDKRTVVFPNEASLAVLQ